MASVDVRSLSKRFGDEDVIQRLDLAVRDGEFLVLLGPSGCGKTTLLRVIAGLEMPTSGDVHIGPRDVTRLQPKDRNVAMVFQNYALYPHLTVFENIAFPLRVRGERGAKLDEKVRWAAKLVAIDDLLDRKPRQTSGGQRQRTALARSLVRDPAVFLLDEPLSNLDAKLRHSAREELRQFQERIGVTAIYVTHDQVEAMGLGDRIVVMNGGKIRQIGTPEEIYTRPADSFVATFVGTPPMNIVPDGTRLVGFRPERFLPIGLLARDDEPLEIAFRPHRVEYLGGDRLVYGQAEAPFAPTEVIARIPSSLPFQAERGSPTRFAVPKAELRFFDPATGLALPDAYQIAATSMAAADGR
jgi:multiple sugar transport system ATP-binding protein